ncbi:hypothetical protein HOI71_01885 [Candidatus Poribacteria bacterium]|nr:hypothetical protein [Candidatus Poribacteria bacterium]
MSASADATPADARAHRFHLRVGSYRVHVALDGVDAHARDVVVDPGEQGIAIDVTDLDGA